jgi:3-deoxy-D-manno-octulosonic-acid transferase
MRWLLDCVYLVAAICLLPLWLWKLPRAPRYRAGILQRLGFSPQFGGRPPQGRKRLWVHCASVGEAPVPARLVATIKERYPGWEPVFSTNTNTGAARLRELYPDCPVFYMPMDFSPCVRLSLGRVQPSFVLLAELEFWPNFVGACRVGRIPVAIINGRIGRGSVRLLRELKRLWPPLWDAVRVCCARSRDDAEGFVAAGLPADRVANCGMLKCDGLSIERNVEREEALRRLFGIALEAQVLVAGSTHQGEETILALAYRDLKRKHRTLRMIVAPRHVERAREVVAALRARGLTVLTKTALEAGRAAVPPDEAASATAAFGAPRLPAGSADAVIVVDTIGDLVTCYGLATCAFVGRSLVSPGGGQNVMEPAALGKPVLTGPHTANFGPEMSLLRDVGGAVVVHNSAQLGREIDRLLSDPAVAERMAAAGRRVITESRGATARTLEKIAPLLQAASGGRIWS